MAWIDSYKVSASGEDSPASTIARVDSRSWAESLFSVVSWPVTRNPASASPGILASEMRLCLPSGNGRSPEISLPSEIDLTIADCSSDSGKFRQRSAQRVPTGLLPVLRASMAARLAPVISLDASRCRMMSSMESRMKAVGTAGSQPIDPWVIPGSSVKTLLPLPDA